MSTTTRNVLILGLAVVAGMLLASFTTASAQQPVSQKRSAPERSLGTEKQSTFSMISPGHSTLQGLAEPINDAILHPSVPGVVMQVHVKEGDFVAEGTPIVTLDNRVQLAATKAAEVLTQSKAALRSAELAVARTESLYRRTKTAFSNNAASKFELMAKENQWQDALTQLDAERESLSQAESNLTLEKARLDDLTLRAPFDGTVIQLFAKLGNSVDSETPAVRIAMHQQLEVQMHLPVALFGRVAQGQTLNMRASAPVEGNVRGVVRYASPVVDPVSGTFRVVFDIANPDLSYPAGFQVWLADQLPAANETAAADVRLTSVRDR